MKTKLSFLALTCLLSALHAVPNIIAYEADSLIPMEADSLIATGKLTADDLQHIWEAMFYGNLKYVDLSGTTIDGDSIPNFAFYKPEQQTSPSGSTERIKLKEILLPGNIRRIGSHAFANAGNLETLNIPDSLREIGEACFQWCTSLEWDHLRLPEGITEISNLSFQGCRIGGSVTLPETIERIGKGAFSSSWLSEIELPSNLKSIDTMAFQETANLEEADIPDGCSFEGCCQFLESYALRRIKLPAGLEEVPEDFATLCYYLEEVELPDNVRILNDRAFSHCAKLNSIPLPNGVEEIGNGVFINCISLREIHFPATLKTIGHLAIDCKNLEVIYSEATLPPVCESETFSCDDPDDVKVYVPHGTADFYRSAAGWNHFSNFIETDDFPTSGITTIIGTEQRETDCIYTIDGVKTNTTPPAGTLHIKNGKKRI